jgi:hypothetical protein
LFARSVELRPASLARPVLVVARAPRLARRDLLAATTLHGNIPKGGGPRT